MGNDGGKKTEGLYTADPKKDRNAKFTPNITVEELDEMDLGDVDGLYDADPKTHPGARFVKDSPWLS